MKFIVDECTGSHVADFLKSLGHDVISVYDDCRGISDKVVLEIANRAFRIIITNDKDFGNQIFKNNVPHKGVLFLRLKNERFQNKIMVIKEFLNLNINMINEFIVLKQNSFKISKLK